MDSGMTGNQSNWDYNVIQPSLAIDSMRRNGYVTTDTAIAEVIDNAVEAKASTIEVYLFEKSVPLKSGNHVSRITEIAVVDNGEGMDRDTLRQSLRFGGGDRTDRKGIGRFGFGLPNSSISQANHVDVWSWKNGIGNAMWCYLDVPEIKDGKYVGVPEPTLGQPPNQLLDNLSGNSKTGTIVYWSNLDPNITWKRGKTVVSHTLSVVGRTYRYFISDSQNSLSIRLVVVDKEGNRTEDKYVHPNDPLYLSPNEELNWPGAPEPMFQRYGNPKSWTFSGADGKKHKVTTTFSFAKKEARQMRAGVVAGKLPHGKHAAENQGISFVRAGREIRLADVVSHERYLDRWWSVEINFTPQLDELFGVTNNKQDASYLADVLRRISSDRALSLNEMIDNGEVDESEASTEMYRMCQYIVEHTSKMMELIKKQNTKSSAQADNDKRFTEGRTPKTVNIKWKDRSEDHPTESEDEERKHPTPKENKRKILLDSLRKKGLPDSDAQDLIQYALDEDRSVIFVDSSPNADGDQIFSPEEQPGAIVEIEFNINHPAYSRIVSALSSDTSNYTEDELKARIENTSEAVKILFAAWVRMELEAKAGKERKQIQRIRQAWGRMAYDFLEDE